MSQRYGTVHAKFWTDSKVQAWPDEGKVLALYFLTGPHSTIAGAMRVPLAYIAADLGWTLKKVQETVTRLSQDGFLTYDERSFWCVVTKRLRYDPPPNPAAFKGVLNALEEMPGQHPAWPALLLELQALADRHKVELPAWIQARVTVARPSPDSVPHPATVTATITDPSSNTPPPPSAGEGGVPPGGGERKRAARGGIESDEFAEFYAAYPRHVARPAAAKAYRRARQRAAAAEILAGLRRAADAWDRAGTQREFIPHPATWLNEERWADEHPPDAPRRSENQRSPPEGRGKLMGIHERLMRRNGLAAEHEPPLDDDDDDGPFVPRTLLPVPYPPAGHG